MEFYNERIYKEKEEFVNKLSETVNFSGNFKALKYGKSVDFSTRSIEETITVICNNDCRYYINVTGDSMIAMMKDVSEFLLKHS